MRAYEIGDQSGINTWKLVDRPDPKPGRGQVAIRVHAVSLNFRDVLLASKGYGFPVHSPQAIAASDGAGEIIAVGEGVSRWKLGDRVAGIFVQNWYGGRQPDNAFQNMLSGALDGVLAEIVVLNQEGVVAIPEHMTYREASTLPVAGVTAWNALYGLKPLKPGQTVLTLGTGGVSIFATQIALAAGARVIITSSKEEKLSQVRKLGSIETINTRSTPEWSEEVLRLTGGLGADYVVETGAPGSLSQSIASVRAGGIVSLLGVPPGESINPVSLLQTSAIVRGMMVGSREMFEALNAFASVAKLRPVIDGVFGFNEAKDALKALTQGNHLGKIVVDVSGIES
ncbi:NAD(P)-dependent alcohol dehydrogenase [Pseudomonas sp. S191]|uniref:zinc-dependent alcohol dehydrogenase family protein n=1 Tax=Pseudomonas sp. S191 TaxID=579575 RepID=UPI00387B3761